MASESLPALATRDLEAGYGRMRIVRGITMDVGKREVVCLIGPNGAGKSTVLKAILGFSRQFAGAVYIGGTEIRGRAPHERVAMGLGYVPQGRQVFPDLTVVENLRMGAFLLRDAQMVAARINEVYDIFPRLNERAKIRAGRLSGGEQQMLAVARAIMMRPHTLLLDEPTLGLAPVLQDHVMENVLLLRGKGLAILMVEQNASLALEVSDRAYIIDQGAVVATGAGSDLLGSDEVRRRYLGAVA